MAKIVKKATVTVAFIIGALFCLIPVSYADSLPPGMVVGDSDGISVDGTGAYYIQKEELLPGDQFTKEIKLMNTEKDDRPYLLELEMSPTEKKGAIDFYEAIEVVMILGTKEVYRGNLIGNGTPKLENKRLELGTYAYGDYDTLTVNFKVSDKLPSDVWQTRSEATMNWTFIATKKPVVVPPGKKPKPKPKPGILPQTGEEWRSLIYKIITGVFIIVVVLLFMKKRRDGDRDNDY